MKDFVVLCTAAAGFALLAQLSQRAGLVASGFDSRRADCDPSIRCCDRRPKRER